jgi:hypothetical protein
MAEPMTAAPAVVSGLAIGPRRRAIGGTTTGRTAGLSTTGRAAGFSTTTTRAATTATALARCITRALAGDGGVVTVLTLIASVIAAG